MKKKMIKELQKILLEEKFKWFYINDERSPYIISNYGRVLSIQEKTNSIRVIQPWLNKDKHLYVSLQMYGERKNYAIHRLVAISFIPNPENKPIVHHSDFDPVNNFYENLEWVTESEHKILHKDLYDDIRPEPKFGHECNLSVYIPEQIHQVCQLLEENALTMTEISNKTGVKTDTIRRIAKGHQWRTISKKYNISNYDKITRKIDYTKYSKELVDQAKTLLKQGYPKNYVKISLKIPEYTVESIFNEVFA